MKLLFFTTATLCYLSCVLLAASSKPNENPVQLKSISIDDKKMLAALDRFKEKNGLTTYSSSDPEVYTKEQDIFFGKILSANLGQAGDEPQYSLDFELVESTLQTSGCLRLPVYQVLTCQATLSEQDDSSHFNYDSNCKKNLRKKYSYGEDRADYIDDDDNEDKGNEVLDGLSRNAILGADGDYKIC